MAFANVDAAILVASMPRREGMEHKDLLQANAKIYELHGKALDQYAKKTVKVIVIIRLYHVTVYCMASTILPVFCVYCNVLACLVYNDGAVAMLSCFW